jgi:hypothetical protein
MKMVTAGGDAVASNRMPSNFHEDLTRGEDRSGPSERRFGLEVGSVLAIAGLWRLRAGGSPWPLLGASAVFLFAALLKPAILRPLNRVWSKVGVVLGRCLNPLVSGVLFLLVFVPAAWISRVSGRDAFHLKGTAQPETYWIQRQQPVSSSRWSRQF